nr:hypothetical protein BaRGS_007829 [Batillaria attramentaria]
MLGDRDAPASQPAIMPSAFFFSSLVVVVVVVEVVNGGYVTQSYKLTGMFSPCGTAISAEGRIIQRALIHFT